MIEHMWFQTGHRFLVEPGRSAEVTGITQRGFHDQRGILKVVRPGKRTVTVHLRNRRMVTSALRFADKYNQACSVATDS